MMLAEAVTKNFLYKGKAASLAIVKLDWRGNPDSISYWENTGRTEEKPHSYKGAYEAGGLVDIWA